MAITQRARVISRDKRAAFVEEYIRTGSCTKAALAAGLSAKSASTQGSNILNQDMETLKAIAIRRGELAKKADYSAVEAMKEARTAMLFAYRKGNSMAYVKAVELRAKIMGLLVDKVDARLLGAFHVNIMGIDGPPTAPLQGQLALPTVTEAELSLEQEIKADEHKAEEALKVEDEIDIFS